MSIKGFSVGGVVQRYDYTALDNLPQGQGVSDDLKAALLQLAQKVAYIDDQGQTYYDDLYDALYPEKTLLSITANFQQGQAVVYNTDSLDSLKQYLTVTAIYDDASTETVPSSAYTLSGTLTTGTSVITVTYEGKTDAFNVAVTAAPMSFTVANNLTGCTTSNSATSVLENTSYTAVITASSGYTLVGATVSITMGGNDITTSAYSGGIITINSVTGALVISVAAVAVVLNSISAVYTQSGTVYDTDTLDSLKADLMVTAHYSDSSTQTVPAADYTLSGTLTVGTSTITVSYGGKTDTFNVTVVHSIPYNLNFPLTDIVLTDGYINDSGEIAELNDNAFYNKLVPAIGCCIVTSAGIIYSTGGNGALRIAEYNSDGEFLSRQYAQASTYITANDNNTSNIKMGFSNSRGVMATAGRLVGLNVLDTTICTIPNSNVDADGNVVSMPDASLSDYLPIESSGYIVAISKSSYDTIVIAFFDANKNILARNTVVPQGSELLSVFEIPSGTEYVRFRCPTNPHAAVYASYFM